ncbi:hypothetical protein EHW64_14750 [Erwinia psidii]|uniref:hypothetical protein n=1 Tax=Erwinia psidii TaxID=69224 RepID=UPI00226B5A49|nr:hypothetical protein [Erwinia psidii]MCX8962357.1 hypothetical protein [Erwinia psidii]
MSSVNSITEAYIEYKTEKLNDNVNHLRKVLPDSSQILYSLKANNNPELIKFLSHTVDGFDIASQEELALISSYVGKKRTLCLTGNDKISIPLSALRDAATKHNLIYSIESPNDFLFFCQLTEQGIDVEGLFRLSYFPSVRYGIFNGLPDSPFGMTAETINTLLSRAQPGEKQRVAGFHLYIGSQISDMNQLSETLRCAVEEIKRVDPDFVAQIHMLNVGGGFPAPYGQKMKTQTFTSAHNLSEELEKVIAESHLPPVSLLFESGRAVTGSAGRLSCTVLDHNLNSANPYVVINSGIAQIAGLYLLRRLKEPDLEFYHGASEAIHTPTIRCRVYGSSCTALDMLGYATLSAHAISVGTVLHCDNLGAYCSNASLNGFHGKAKISEIIN